MAGGKNHNQKPVRCRGKILTPEQIKGVRDLVHSLRGLTRRQISIALCRKWNWRRSKGSLNLEACGSFLRRLDERGLIDLPEPRNRRGTRRNVWQDLAKNEVFVPPGDIRPADLDLGGVVVRPILRAETPRWRELMARFHYLGDGVLVGESLRYVAEFGEDWLALLSWSVAAWKSRHREQYVGWNDAQKQKRLSFVVNNSRFLILPWVRVPHLASCSLASNLRRLSDDWVAYYGHKVLLAETFIDLERYRGTCYRASNWQYLGNTRGMARKGQGYESHGKSKGMFVFPLHRRAREILSAPFPSPEILEQKNMATLPFELDVNRLPIFGNGGLLEMLQTLTDPRMKRGVRYPLQSVIALAVLASLSGMRSYEAIAEWASDVPTETLRELRCWRRKGPSEPTFRRVLQSIDAAEVDRVVYGWLRELETLPGQGVALDGKTLRGSSDGDKSAFHLLAAITHEGGVVIAQESIGEKTNEITHAASTLKEVDLTGATVTADAMHTQRKFARHLVEEKEADFVFIAKDNQPTLLEDLKLQHEDDFSPSGSDI